jgi:hypothetical protein
MYPSKLDPRASFDTAFGALLWDAWNAGNEYMFDTVDSVEKRKDWDAEDRRLNRDMVLHVILPAYKADELSASDVHRLMGLYR